MTMQFLSAAELAIQPAEHRALLEVRELFAKGVFKHDPDLSKDKANGFNMAEVEASSKCGTSCCIGGWMWHAMDRHRTTRAISANRYVNDLSSDALTELFFPSSLDEMSWEDITPGAALVAIDQFLTTGEVNWNAACGLDQAVKVRPE